MDLRILLQGYGAAGIHRRMEYDDDTQTQTPSDSVVKIDFDKLGEFARKKFWKEVKPRILAGESLQAISEETGVATARLIRQRQKNSWWAWDAIKEAACMGVPTAEISRRFGAPAAAIRNRSAREVWPTPARIAAESMVGSSDCNLVASEETRSNPAEEVGVLEPLDPKATLEEIAKVYENGIARMAMEKARQGILYVAAPKNWRDIKTADDIARRAAGLGKDAGKVATLFKVGFGQTGEPTVEMGVMVDLPNEDEA